tara:strand:+ start:14115 stop:21281 length:7167 start_codon:yes stop_codon:yes gene_type:complete
MNEEYLKGLHGHLNIEDDYDTWINNIVNNEEYLKGLHGHIGVEDDYDTWSSSIFGDLKKKDESVSVGQEVVTESLTPQGEEVTSLDTTIQEDEKASQIIPTKTSASVATDSELDSIPKEKLTAIEREFGKNTFTDFFGDIYRAGVQGQAQGGTLDEAMTLFSGGADVSDEQIQEFIIANKELANVPPSDEMQDFQKIYEKNDGGVLGFILGVANNPTVIPQLFVSSVSAMANPESAKYAAMGAAGGAAVGSVVPIIGTATGALGGLMAGAGGALETGLTFAELLQEEVDGELTKESIRKVLEDEDAYNRIRNKSLARGLTIAAIEGLSGGLAGKVTSKVVGMTGRKLAGTAAGIGVESVGGSVGEVAGRLAAGQEMDVAEIGFEGIAGTATAPLSVGYGLYKAPKYSINKSKNGASATVTGPQMAEFLRTASPDDIRKAEVNIENDSELKSIYDKRFQEANTQKDILAASPEMNEPTLKAVTELQIQLDALEGNKTQAAKDKAAVIKAEIKSLQENPITEGEARATEVVVDDKGVTTTTNIVTDEYVIETLNKEGVPTPTQEEIDNRKQELLKEQADAIQEPSAETVDVQEQTTVSEGVREGDTAITDITEEVTQEEVQEQDVPTDLQSEIDELEQIFPSQAVDNADAQFQLGTATTPEQKKQALVDEAVAMMDDADNQTKLEENAFDAENPAPEVKVYSIEVKENTELAAKVKRMGLSELIGKKVNLVMADQLKVGDVKIGDKNLKRMGGPFFPMMDELFGKIAWASIDPVAAKKIINGAIKSDYSVVYNMNPSAVDSNVAILETFVESVKSLPEQRQSEVFSEMKLQLKKLKFGKNTEAVNSIADKATSLNELMSLIEDFNVDTKADIMTKLVPSKDVKAGTALGNLLQDSGITIEDIRDANIEQFAADLPAGAMTTVLQITDKNGNPITKETANEAIVTREQQEAEGLPTHQNYPVYIRGKAVGLLNETVPFWNMYKSSMSSLDAKAAGIVKKTVPETKTKPATERKITAKEAISNEMRAASMTASQAKALSKPNTTQYQKFVSLLKRSFPNVEVVTNQKEFDALLEDLNSRKLSTKNQKVYGAVLGGKLYLNPSLENFNTPIHEFGHIWLNIAKEAKPALFKKGISLIKGTPYEAQIKESPEYKRVIKQMLKDGATQSDIDNYILEEALATAIGNQGEAFVSAAQQRNFKNWLNDLYSFVRTMTGLSQYSPQQLQDITLEDFLQGVNVDLLSGNEVFAEFEAKGLSDALQLMTDSSRSKVIDFVKKARGLGYSEVAIETVLTNKGVEVEVVSEVMATEKKATTKPKVTEELVPGYDRLANEVEGIIEKSKKRGVKFDKIVDNAIEYIKGSRVYETATDTVREQLIRDIRKQFGLKEKTAPTVSRLLGVIKDVKKITIKETELLKIRLNEAVKAAKGAKDAIAKAQQDLANDIKALVSKGQLTQRQAAALVKKFSQTDITKPKSVDAFVDYVAKVFNDSEGKYKKSVIKDILKFVTDKSKKALTDSNKVRGKGLDAQGQQFFTVAKRVLQSILDGEINYQEIEKKFFPDIDDVLSKEGKLTTKEQSQLDAYVAFEAFKGIEGMSTQEVEQLFQDLKNVRSESISRLKDKIEIEKKELKAIKEEANKDISEGYPELYDKDGEPLTEEQLRAKQNERYHALMSGKLGKAFKSYLAEFPLTKPGKFLSSIANNLKHLGTLTNGLDKVGKFFSNNVYRALNKMESAYAKGLQETRTKMDEIASTIDGIKSYKDIQKKLATGVHKITGITTGEGKSLGTDLFNSDQLMRVYALSKNDVQREKLRNQGFTDEKIQEIEKILGKEVVEFTDKVVEYLSNEYFEQSNDIYSDVNNVNLGYVENYFPTQTIQQKVNSKLLDEGDFNGVFNAQIAPALKERVDTEGDVSILNIDFTTALDNHFETIERYKAYAKGVKKLNSIFKFKSIDILLDQTGLSKVVRNAVNYAVNPNGGQQVIQPTIIDRLMTKYTGFALAFKLAQVVKQSTSFVNAFEDYSYRGKGKKKVPGLDLTMFMIDTAKTIATLPYQIQKAYKMSPMFRERVRKGLEGDVFGLETGSTTFKPIGKSHSLWGKAVRGFKTAAGSPTVLGDILGVMGYMINYNRDISNGMSEAAALEKFENYNATQQSRRATEKIPLQMNTNSLIRGFTMFGSTLFLQMNKVMQGFTNVMSTASKGKVPSAKDVRAIILNLGVANVMFALAANLAKFIEGDDEDRDEALLRMKDAMKGLNLIYQVPYFGASIEAAVNKSRGIHRPVDVAINPFSSISRKIKKLSSDNSSVGAATRVAVELAIGAQLDPFVGLANGFTDGFDEDVMYDVLGVSSSYRPSKETATSSSEIKRALKESNPKMYNRLYGPGSTYYKQEQRIKKMKAKGKR